VGSSFKRVPIPVFSLPERQHVVRVKGGFRTISLSRTPVGGPDGSGFSQGNEQLSPAMKHPALRFVFLAGVVAFACAVSAPLIRAAEQKSGSGGPKTERKTEQDDEALRKHDRNGNGKLDPDEEAALKAEQEKAKSDQKKKERRGA
jgi:hypothetical protein